MSYQLTSHLSFCRAGPNVLFLDLNRDRYFRLKSELASRFIALVDDDEVSEQAVAELLRIGVIRTADGPTQIKPAEMLPASSKAAAATEGALKPTEVIRALSLEATAYRKLKAGQLHKLIAQLRLDKAGSSAAATLTADFPVRVIRAYEVAKLIRSPADRCLSRSIALVRRLAHHNFEAQLVIGVRAEPFAAHSWVQTGDVVLNDSPEEVCRFTPIFVA